jgi:hypothetical protein
VLTHQPPGDGLDRDPQCYTRIDRDLFQEKHQGLREKRGQEVFRTCQEGHENIKIPILSPRQELKLRHSYDVLRAGRSACHEYCIQKHSRQDMEGGPKNNMIVTTWSGQKRISSEHTMFKHGCWSWLCPPCLGNTMGLIPLNKAAQKDGLSLSEMVDICCLCSWITSETTPRLRNVLLDDQITRWTAMFYSGSAVLRARAKNLVERVASRTLRLVDPEPTRHLADPGPPGQLVEPMSPGHLVDPGPPAHSVDPGPPGHLADPEPLGHLADQGPPISKSRRPSAAGL